MKKIEETHNFIELGLDGLLKVYNFFHQSSSDNNDQNSKLKLVLLLKLNRRRLIQEYQHNRETERKVLYDNILSKIDTALEADNDTAIKCAYDCIKTIYGDETESIDADKTKIQNLKYMDNPDYYQWGTLWTMIL